MCRRDAAATDGCRFLTDAADLVGKVVVAEGCESWVDFQLWRSEEVRPP